MSTNRETGIRPLPLTKDMKILLLKVLSKSAITLQDLSELNEFAGMHTDWDLSQLTDEELVTLEKLLSKVYK